MPSVKHGYTGAFFLGRTSTELVLVILVGVRGDRTRNPWVGSRGSVRGEYRLCTDLEVRRYAVACLVHEPEELSFCSTTSSKRNAPRALK